jgi:S-layer protein
MNMISTGAFRDGMDASDKQKNLLVNKLVGAWERKNSKTARAGGVSLMALSLAACGSSDDTSDGAIYTQTQYDSAKLAAAAAVDITSDNATVIATAVAAVDTTSDNAAAVSLALRNAAAEAGATTFDGQSDAALISAIKTADNAGISDAAVVALSATDANGAAITTLAGLDVAYEALANPVETSYTMKTTTDDIDGNASDNTINAAYSSSAGMTFQAGDNIDGGAGTDTLVVTIGTTGTHQATSLTNVETVNVTFSAAGTLSLLGSTGVTTVNAQGSTAAASVTNIPLGTALEVMNTDQDATLAFKASSVTGSSDSATVTLKNVTGGTLTVAAIETLNLVSSLGGNTLADLTAAAANTVNISGDQTLTITAANTVAETINGSTATGALTLTTDNTNAATISGGSGNDSITSTGTNNTIVTINAGAGNDTITHSANLASTDVIDGGAGTDTLVSTTALLKALTINTTTAKITNIESVTVTDEYTDSTNAIDTSALIQVTGIQTVTLQNSSTTANDDITTGAEVLTMSAGANTLNLGASAAGNVSVLGGALTVNDTGTANNDSIVVNNKSLNSTTGQNLDIGDNATGTFIFGGYETVTLDTGQGSGNIEQDHATIDVNPDTASTDVSLTITGKNALDISTDVTTTSTGKLTIDASGMTAQATGVTTFDLASTVQGTGGTLEVIGSAGEDIVVSGAFAATLTGGAGADSLTGSSANDTLTGGAGNDTLVALGGTDTISGGDGNDTLTMTTAGTYTITGGAGNDTADFAGTLTQADSFDGGDGTDTLTINNASVTAVNALSVSNINTLNAGMVSIEKINFGTDLAQDIDLGRLDGISSVILGNLGGDVTMSGVGATNNVEISATTGQALTLTLNDATGTADVVNLNISGSAVVAANTITAANVETVNITGSDQTAGAAGNINTATLVATKATSVVVTGNDGLNLTNTGNTKITNFDASGVVATDASDTAANMAVTFVSANTSTVAAVSIKGGAGNDGLTGNASIDTITGGAGTDTITASAGNDVSTGGAGADTFSFTAALLAANSGTTATFDGGAGTDIMSISDTGATIVDADFRGITTVETFTSGNGTNALTFGVVADTTGLTAINGGTGADTINVSSVDFDNTVTITGGQGADVHTLGTQTATVVLTDDTDNAADASGSDNISGFTTTVDKIHIDDSAFTMNGSAGAVSYYEGAASSMTAGTAYDVVAITGTSYANVSTVEAAIAAVSTSATVAMVIFHDTSANVRMFFDTSLGVDANLADTDTLSFTDISTNAFGGSFAAADFALIA